jgi:hypothetical protein
MTLTRTFMLGVAGVAVCFVAHGRDAADGARSDDALRRVAPELGFSVAVPGADWACIPGGPHGYMCKPKSGDPTFAKFGVLVSEPSRAELTREDVGEFVRGSLESAKGHGWATEEPTIEASTIPFPGCWRFSYKANTAEHGPTVTLVAYIGEDRWRRKLTFMHLAVGATEPAIFRSFVQSFRWTGNPPQPPESTRD